MLLLEGKSGPKEKEGRHPTSAKGVRKKEKRLLLRPTEKKVGEKKREEDRGLPPLGSTLEKEGGKVVLPLG